MAPPLLLVIDDNHADVGLIREALRDTGPEIAVEHLAEGHLALERFAAAHDDPPPRLPDLVVCDLRLPDMTGDEIIRALRADRSFAAVPVLLMSGQPVDVVVAQTGAPASMVRQKPIDFEGFVALATELRRLIAKR